MGASDKTAEGRNEATRPDEVAASQSSSFASLTRTLEDLEARLSRLSSARQAVRERSGDIVEPAAKTTAETTPEPAKAGRRSVLDRRFGTIAGEVETLQMQGATLRLVNGLADDLQALRAEIRENVEAARGAEQFDEVRTAFLELRQLIEAREDKGRVGGEISQILDRLSNLQLGPAENLTLETLRAELDGVGALVSKMAREESLASVNKRWDEFEVRLSEQVALNGAARSDLRAELERLRESVRSLATDEQIRAVEQRWEEFEERYLDKVRVQTEEQFTRILKVELDALRARLDRLAEEGAPGVVASRIEAIETRFSPEALEAGFSRLGERIADIESALAGLPDAAAVERLDQRMQALARAIAEVAARQDEPELEHFIVLEERLDEISQAIVTAALRENAGLDMAPIERIEARIADLSTRVDALTAEGKADVLCERVAQLSAKIDELAARPADADLDARMAKISERFETALVELRSAAPDLSVYEGRLAELADRLDATAAAQVDGALLRSLEGQIAALSQQLAGRPAGEAAFDAGPVVEARLAEIERRLDTNHEALIAAARTAADEAVRMVLAGGETRESAHVLALSEDLKKLEALSRETDERSMTVFSAVHATLLKVADRLEGIESEMTGGAPKRSAAPAKDAAPAPFTVPRSEGNVVAPLFADAPSLAAPAEEERVEDGEQEEDAPQEKRGIRAAIGRLRLRRNRKEQTTEDAAAAEPAIETAPILGMSSEEAEPRSEREFVEAPTLDASDSILSREANRPLEPGSGAPDIASLIERVRQQQLAADRAADRPRSKSDFIAAARKAAMAAASEAEALNEKQESEEAPDPSARISNRRKPILMAVGAVLLAMMAMPVGQAMLEAEFAERTAEPEAGESEVAAVEASPGIDPMTVASVPADRYENAAGRGAADAERNATAAPIVAIAPVTEPAPALAAPVAEAEAEVATTSRALTSPTPLATPVAFQPTLAEAAPGEAFEPSPAPPAVPEPTPEPELSLMERALGALPEAAAADLPAPPAGIGPSALVEAAKGGDAKAMFEIGLRLMEGQLGAPRPEEAFTWFAQSGKRGFAPAQYSLGTLFEKGNGVERAATSARDWYTLAAEAGNVRAMHNLAVLYAGGIEGRADPETAARWFEMAAERGMRDSQYNLGILFARGAGVPQDLAQSYKWFSIVGAAGDKDALSKRDTVAKSLTAEERGKMDAEASAFRPLASDDSANTADIPPEWAEPAERTASEAPNPQDTSRAIRNVQAILAGLGYDPGVPDGVVGERTTKAVIAFQKENGLAETGEIDAVLIRALLEKKDA